VQGLVLSPGAGYPCYATDTHTNAGFTQHAGLTARYRTDSLYNKSILLWRG